MELYLETFDVVARWCTTWSTTVQPLVEKNGNRSQSAAAASSGTCTPTGPVRQVLFNLLSNAGKFTERDDLPGRCRAMSRRRAGLDGLPVADTGIGMTPEQIGAAVPGFHPGGCVDHAQIRRHRSGPGDQPPVLRDDGRRYRGRRRAGFGRCSFSGCRHKWKRYQGRVVAPPGPRLYRANDEQNNRSLS